LPTDSKADLPINTVQKRDFVAKGLWVRPFAMLIAEMKFTNPVFIRRMALPSAGRTAPPIFIRRPILQPDGNSIQRAARRVRYQVKNPNLLAVRTAQSQPRNYHGKNANNF
jgi:hypothetical protein